MPILRPEDAWQWRGWPTLGWLIADWIEEHCPIPDGFRRGAPFEMYAWQLYCTARMYQVREGAIPGGTEHFEEGQLVGVTSVASAYVPRRSQVVGPQKIGKGPWTATLALAEGCGPTVFDGWAVKGEIYDCAAHGCSCGWQRWYQPGEPKGKRWPTPLIQLTATSEDQIATNVYRPLQEMVRLGPLAGLVNPLEDHTAIDGGGRIDVVTARANSRLGNPVTWVLHDESGLYTKSNGMVEVADTQSRGAAAMGGRTLETTNAWDPSQQSRAQATAAAAAEDIFRYHLHAPEALNYALKAERKKIHRWVYAGTPHVDLTVIEAEAAELMERDPAQAERFYGNRTKAGSSRAIDMGAWAENAEPDTVIAPGRLITLGVDGARFRDALAIVATDVLTGFQWRAGLWEVPTGLTPEELEHYEHPKDEVDQALADAFDRWHVWRAYVDPGGIDEWMRGWQGLYGNTRVVPWYMSRLKPTAFAVRRWVQAVHAHDQSHNGDPDLTRHVRQAHKLMVNAHDDDHRPMFVLAKERHDSPEKMDGAAAAVISWEARGDAIAAGAPQQGLPPLVIGM